MLNEHFLPKISPCSLGVGGWPLGFEDVGLIVRAISFENFRPMWSWSTNVTDRQTDRQRDSRQTTCDLKTALCIIVHRAVKTMMIGLIVDSCYTCTVGIAAEHASFNRIRQVAPTCAPSLVHGSSGPRESAPSNGISICSVVFVGLATSKHAYGPHLAILSECWRCGLIITRSHPEMVGDMSRVIVNLRP